MRNPTVPPCGLERPAWGILLVLSMHSIQRIEVRQFKSLRIEFDAIAGELEHTDDSVRRRALIERAKRIVVEVRTLVRQMNKIVVARPSLPPPAV